MIQFHETTEPTDIERIAAIAAEIWREHYTDMIGAGQVEYMLENFQSAEAITRQIENEGYRYFVAEEDGDFLGYGALQMTAESDRLFLSKYMYENPLAVAALGGNCSGMLLVVST